MEFLNDFAEARMLGFTKEEFLPIWETLAKTKQITEECKVLQMRQDRQIISLTATNNQRKESNMEPLNLSMRQLEQEMKQLHHKMESVQNTLKHQQEQQRYHIQKQDEMMKEFHQLLKILSDNFLNGLETINMSLKQFIEDKLGKTLNAQVIDANLNLCVSETSSELKNHVYLHEQVMENQQVHSLNRQTDQLAIENQQVHSLNRQTDQLAIEERQVEEKVVKNEKWNLVDQRQKLKKEHKKANTGDHVTEHSQQTSSGATGFYADKISNMKSQETNIQGRPCKQGKSSMDLSDHCESKEMGGLRSYSKEASRRNNNAICKNDAITYIPDDGSEFSIPNVKVFQALKKDFFTESIYTRPKPCKVRLRLWFNKRGRLGVHLLVSEGVLDERYKWPMVFSGNGYIFNQTSQTYTKLWTIESQECHMPVRNKEHTLGAYVCLFTSRELYEEVTYDLLMKKRYVSDDDEFLFKWDLNATEKLFSGSTY